MSEGNTRGDGRTDTETGADDDVGVGHPSLGEFVRARVSDLFSRLEGDDFDGLYRLVIGEVEVSLLEAVMNETGGNQGRAARILGINRGTLRKKLRAHGLASQAPQPTGGGGG